MTSLLTEDCSRFCRRRRGSSYTAHSSSLDRYSVSGAVWLLQLNNRTAKQNLCALEHEASADHAGVVKCGRIYDCYTRVLLSLISLLLTKPQFRFEYSRSPAGARPGQ